MKLQIIISIMLLCILITGCTTQVSTPSNDSITPNSEITITSNSEKTESNNVKDADIVVSDGQLVPSEFTLSTGSTTTFTIHNQQDVMVRIDVPMYGSQVSVDIPANSYDTITLSPKYKGYATIELNGNSAGTITVN